MPPALKGRNILGIGKTRPKGRNILGMGKTHLSIMWNKMNKETMYKSATPPKMNKEI